MPSTAEGVGWQEIRPRHGTLDGLDAREVWSYRHLAVALVRRELKVRYKQTVIGVAWVIVQPLVGVVLFTLVFGGLAGLPSDGLPYAVFVYAGLIIWTYLSASIDGATRSLVENRELLTKVYFPRILAPAAATVPRLIDLAVSLAAFVVVAAVAGVAPGPEVLLLPLWLLLAMALALGTGALFGALNVRYRDVGQALGLTLQLWLFASPVVFASSSVEGPLRTLLALNPATGLVDGFRWSLAGATPPPLVDLLSLASGLAVLVAGLAYFLRTERRFADLV
jgi:ABC-type polysaccharide/polyol phosphate export permease